MLQSIIENVSNVIEPFRNPSLVNPLKHEEVIADPFWDFYNFNQSTIIVIQNILGQLIRANPKDITNLETTGTTDQYAQWLARLDNNEKRIRFQNLRTSKYLRINNGISVDCNGDGGKDCIFRIHHQSIGCIKLESKEYPEKFINFEENEIKVGKNDYHYSRILCFIKGSYSPFIKPYLFDTTNQVVIEHQFGKYFGVASNESIELDIDGDRSILSQWECQLTEDKQFVKLRNWATGKFLKIEQISVENNEYMIDCNGVGDGLCVFKVYVVEFPNHVKLESVKYPDVYVAVDGKRARVGKGGGHCCLYFYQKA